MIPYRIFYLFAFLSYTCLAQVKFEKEERIRKEALPVSVIKLLPLMETNAKHFRYYREFDGQIISYEVKFKKHNTQFSVEFDKEGTLEDVEVLIPKAALPKPVMKSVQAHFQRPKYIRLQKQFVHPIGTNAAHTLQTILEKYPSSKHDISINSAYEIVVFGKTQKGYRQFELLIDSDGTLLKKRNILAKNYDHVVY